MRGRGGFIGANVTPASAAINSAASGVWTVREAEALKRAGTWPRAFEGPTSVSGLQLWLDAADASTLYDATTGGALVAADGGVARWEDKSGNARHATQGTAANRPARKTAVQGGRDVLRFDGSNDSFTLSDFADLATGQAITVICVAKRTGTGSTHTLLTKFDAISGNGNSEDGWFFRFTSSDTLNFGVAKDANYTQETSISTVSASAASVLAFKATSGSLTASAALYKNGQRVSSSSTGTVDSLDNTTYPVVIGRLDFNGVAYDFWNGDICEIIIYNSALSDTDRALVESYLLAKWGIA